MKRIVLLAFVSVLLFSMLVVMHFAVSVKAEPKTWIVDDDGPADFSIIKDAINAASSGDTILVKAGTYYESDITPKNNLSLIGENKDNTIIDGKELGWIIRMWTTHNVTITGFTIQNSPIGTAGIWLHFSTKNNISNNIIKNHDTGIYLTNSEANLIEDNWVANNYEGIILSTDCKENRIRGNNIINNTLLVGAGVDLTNGAHDNEVENNNIAQNTYGILISHENNSIFGNRIVKNAVGIYEWLEPTYGYKIFHNNFINNTKQVDLGNSSVNAWDNGVEGNYWSDYNGTDFDQDSIGGTPYVINGKNNTDHCPLVGMFSDFPVNWGEETYHITTVCNSTISEFQFNDIAKTISFNVTGPDGTLGFCRVTIPNVIVQGMWQYNYTVLANGETVEFKNWTDDTNSYIYFIYQHPEHEVVIIPEFPTWTSILLMLIIYACWSYILKHARKKEGVQAVACSCWFLFDSKAFVDTIDYQ